MKRTFLERDKLHQSFLYTLKWYRKSGERQQATTDAERPPNLDNKKCTFSAIGLGHAAG
jgi:hypothetical protein